MNTITRDRLFLIVGSVLAAMISGSRTRQHHKARFLRQKMKMLTALTLAVCSCAAASDRHHAMVLIPAGKSVVGTSAADRERLAERFDCHPTWLGDDLSRREVKLPAFWIDRYPVTNAQYLAFVRAAEHPRPSWWGRWGGVFPAEYADHPVVGVSGRDAAAYAAWSGKRLPCAEEWERAIGHPEYAVFAWGDDWPGPWKARPPSRVFWELPETRPVGSGERGRSSMGVEDFTGQTLEWVSDVRPHHGVQFQLMKGASWFHEDPLSFRTAAGWYAYEGWRSTFTGFRCALDADRKPPVVGAQHPTEAVRVEEARQQLAKPAPSPITLAAPGGTSRHLSIRVPYLGHETFAFSAPETVLFNGTSMMTWRKTPDMTWTVRSAERAAYAMRMEDLRLDAEFLAGDDWVLQRFTMTNQTGREGNVHTSSCFNLQNHPEYYDGEQLRTYVLDHAGRFIPMRRLSRGGECVRWITGPRMAELGEPVRHAVLAVVSRDGRTVIGSGRAGENAGFSVSTNAMFTCLHTDSGVRVPAGGQVTTRQLLWFLEGDLDDLRRRVIDDLRLDHLVAD